MRQPVKPEQQIDFLLSLIREDIHHCEKQAEIVNQWIHMSILSLKHAEVSQLEALRDEYKQKASMQKQNIKELQKTLGMYQVIQTRDQHLNQPFKIQRNY
ncbi:MAG TPA: hypothetical protein VGI04_02690 [Neobacillus sp.]